MKRDFFNTAPTDEGPGWEFDHGEENEGPLPDHYTPWHGRVDELIELADKFYSEYRLPLPPMHAIEKAADVLTTMEEAFTVNEGREAKSRKGAARQLEKLRFSAWKLQQLSESQAGDFVEARRRMALEWDIHSGQSHADLSIVLEAKQSGESYEGAADLFFVLSNLGTLIEETIKQYADLDEVVLVPTEFTNSLAGAYESLFPPHKMAQQAFVDFWSKMLTGSGVSYDSLYNATTRRPRPSPTVK